jgi:lysine-ketoglutarate reductase/saccharopine dehydrogenase-like protein (TIGR00300 family)
MSRYLGAVLEGGGRYEIRRFDVGRRRTDFSTAEIEVRAPSRPRLQSILDNLVALGCRLVEETPVRLVPAPREGVAPEGFYSTTHHRTRVRLPRGWREVANPRMDAVIVVRDGAARSTLLRDLRRGDPVVCGVEGVEILPPFRAREAKAFAFMRSEASSERALEVRVRAVARAMRAARARGGRIVAVPGPVVVHTGGAPHLAALVRRGWVDALLAGNALAVHDAEQALFGTSLGVDLRTGLPAREGHMNHLRAINEVRRAGSLARAVARGRLRSGIFHACARAGVPFVLAGSIRDDGPLPDTEMDLLRAQERYARALTRAGLVLVLGSMLHGIGVGNMLPSDVPLVCVDINPAVVTKLADRGSGQAIGVVTDVGVFLHRLARALPRRARRAR